MQHIDESRLELDVDYRFGFLSEFMEFTEDDVATLHAAARWLAPLVPTLVDAVYDKLFSYDATKRHFVPRQSGYDGTLPENVDHLELDHEMIEFRKQHLARYLKSLVTKPYDGNLVRYLDFVGSIHTPKAGNPELDIPLVQMNALMGFVAQALLATILDLDLDVAEKHKAVCAFTKVLWLQNDLINRHYTEQPASTG